MAIGLGGRGNHSRRPFRLDQQGLEGIRLPGLHPQQHLRAGASQAIDADGSALKGLTATELGAIHQGPGLSACGQIAVEGAVIREARRKRQFPPLEQGQFPQHLVIANPGGLELQKARKQVVSSRPTGQQQRRNQ